MCVDTEFLQCELDLEGSEGATFTNDIKVLDAEFLAAKLATERERCELLKIKVRKAKGELIPIDDVKKAMFAKGRIIRDGVLNIPDRIAPLLLNKSDASEIHSVLMRELRGVLKELSQDDQER
jgi:hypothetical protein